MNWVPAVWASKSICGPFNLCLKLFALHIRVSYSALAGSFTPLQMVLSSVYVALLLNCGLRGPQRPWAARINP